MTSPQGKFSPERRARVGPKAYWALAAVASSALFFAIAISNAVYVTTSPPWFEYHVLLRKIYSVAAFAIVAFCINQSLKRKPPRVALFRLCAVMAVYSALIEYFQWLGGSLEGLRWNLIDVICGVLGALAALLVTLVTERAGSNGRGRRGRAGD